MSALILRFIFFSWPCLPTLTFTDACEPAVKGRRQSCGLSNPGSNAHLQTLSLCTAGASKAWKRSGSPGGKQLTSLSQMRRPQWESLHGLPNRCRRKLEECWMLAQRYLHYTNNVRHARASYAMDAGHPWNEAKGSSLYFFFFSSWPSSRTSECLSGSN